MDYTQALEIAKRESKIKFELCSEYEDAFIFEQGDNVMVVWKNGKVTGLTDYILETYRDLEDDLIKEYKIA